MISNWISASDLAPRVGREDFLGRERELTRLLGAASDGHRGLPILVLAAPAAGASELLKQTFHHLFQLHSAVVPVYFDCNAATNTNLGETFDHWRLAFLAQLCAFRRRDLSLVDACRSPEKLIEQSAPRDYGWITEVVRQSRAPKDASAPEASLVLLIDALQQAKEHGVFPLLLFDNYPHLDELPDGRGAGREVFERLSALPLGLVCSGLRRSLFKQINFLTNGAANAALLKLDRLPEDDARSVVERYAERRTIKISEPTRDLIAEELGGLPGLIVPFLRAAEAKEDSSLETFLSCQRLYVEQIFAGSFYQRFSRVIVGATSRLATRRLVLRLLKELIDRPQTRIFEEEWFRRFDDGEPQIERLFAQLHQHEVINRDQNVFTPQFDIPWQDFIRISFELQIEGLPRGRVLTEALMDALKRAPQMMGRLYRRQQSVDLPAILRQFDCQPVPLKIFQINQRLEFNRDSLPDAGDENVQGEKDAIKLPQIVAVQPAGIYRHFAPQKTNGRQVVIAHGFENGSHTEVSEIVWLAAEIHHQHEAGRREIEEVTHALLQLARANQFERFRLWLVGPGNLSREAAEYLRRQNIFYSDRSQVEMLRHFLTEKLSRQHAEDATDEFEIVVPFGADAELIAATAAGEIARRMRFETAAVNQIKTALIEASLNAADVGPRQGGKIYHRFRLELDRLVITVAGGAISSAHRPERNGEIRPATDDQAELNGDGGRRGWGLAVIKQLMDEVKFEYDGGKAGLKMIKYLRVNGERNVAGERMQEGLE